VKTATERCERSDSITVYPGRGRVLAHVIAFGILTVVFVLTAVADTSWHGDTSPFDLSLALLLWACALFAVVGYGWYVLQSLGQLRSPRPSLRLDEDGLECARGRISWRAALLRRGAGEPGGREHADADNQPDERQPDASRHSPPFAFGW
jgi:hypothetical protein